MKSLSGKFTLNEIKNTVNIHLGSKVKLRTNLGRKKISIREGILDATYPSIFVVRLREGRDMDRKLSFCYSDILTETVEIRLCDTDKNIMLER